MDTMIELPAMRRSAELAPNTTDADSRTVEVVWSAERDPQASQPAVAKAWLGADVGEDDTKLSKLRNKLEQLKPDLLRGMSEEQSTHPAWAACHAGVLGVRDGRYGRS